MFGFFKKKPPARPGQDHHPPPGRRRPDEGLGLVRGRRPGVQVRFQAGEGEDRRPGRP
ncbi:MAG: hypothetical protein WDN45_18735 [Caulobacteraceae bacterium]